MGGRVKLSAAESAWSLTEAANEPYFNLVQRYVFAPYFAGVLAATAAIGQSTWAFALSAAGLVIAILAPVLGSIADSGARLKPWLAGAGLVGAVASASLWFAAPGVSLLPVALAVFVGIVAVELMHQFTNAFLPSIARPARIGLLSGMAFGFSQLSGILVLLVVLYLGRSPPAWLASVPNGVDRIVGPMAAGAIILFLAPFLLLSKDRAGTARASARRGLRDLGGTLGDAWRDRRMRLFLLGRMVTADGMTIVFVFGSVLAAATFGWKADSLAVFGLVITLFGVLGGFGGGALDGRIGPLNLVLSGIVLMAIGTAMVLLTDETRLLGVATGVAVGSPFQSPQEWGFLAAGALIAAGAAFSISGMRTMMALLAPPAKSAAYFGLFAFVGKATAFIGPFFVGLLAAETGSVRPGIALALLFLGVGFVALLAVGSPNRRVA